jgi:hypothetical protein
MTLITTYHSIELVFGLCLCVSFFLLSSLRHILVRLSLLLGHYNLSILCRVRSRGAMGAASGLKTVWPSSCESCWTYITCVGCHISCIRILLCYIPYLSKSLRLARAACTCSLIRDTGNSNNPGSKQTKGWGRLSESIGRNFVQLLVQARF